MKYTVKYKITPGLIVYSVISVIYLYMTITLVQVYQNVIPSNENTLLLIKYKTYYYTGWNLVVQVIFVILAFLDELVVSWTGEPNDVFRKLRSYVFTTFVFPNGVMLVIGFWWFFCYDRELMYPRNVDDDLPPFTYIFLHLFVIFPVIAEIFVARKYKFRPFRGSLVTLAIFLITYNIRLISLYFLYGVWLYPFYRIMSGTLMFLWTVLAITSCLIVQKIGETLQIYMYKYSSEDKHYWGNGIERKKAI